MKKRLTIIIIASFLLFQGADSTHEGLAAVAPNGVLPPKGLFVTTNRFPKNTLVEITNIENGKKANAVYVTDNWTNPGILAVVSHEVAELLGMREGSECRIRMIKIIAPYAFINPLPERQNAPVFDPENIDEEKLEKDLYGNDKFPPVASQPTVTPIDPPTWPPYIVGDEWLEKNGSSQIVDLHGYPPPVTQTPPDNKFEKEIVEPLYITEHHDEDKDKNLPTEMNEIHPKEEIVKEVPEFITQTPRPEVIKEVSPWQDKVEVAALPIQPEVVTPPIQRETEQKRTNQQIYELVESPLNPPPFGVYGIDPNDIISGITSTPKETEMANLNPSIRTIPSLDRGKYYVQVAALSADLVENAFRQIDRRFNPGVFKGSDNLYRILIGPLNQGESAAVLVRFKSIGYKDAILRIGG